MEWTPEGGNRRLDRPQRPWRDTFIEDMQEMGVSGSGTQQPGALPMTLLDEDEMMVFD